jgi:hypothetical protein
MFTQFFDDQKDAWHYAKVMSILSKDFRLHRKDIEETPAELNVLESCGKLRRQGHNVETTTLILLTTLLDMKSNFPEHFKGFPVDPELWRIKTFEWLRKGLIPDELFMFFDDFLTKHAQKMFDEDPYIQLLKKEAAKKAAEAELRERLLAEVKNQRYVDQLKRNLAEGK